ncbi:MAG TPA: alpha/beta hydrolase [Acidimicrobiales bacterium]
MDRVVTSDGTAVAVHTFEPPTAAEGLPTVVLQHGFAADTQTNWVAPGVVAALRTAGRRVVSVDARGHGESDKPHDPDRYGEGRMARDLVEVFDALGLTELDLVGYSMGAIISLVTATTERRVRRMVIGGVGGAVVDMGGVDRRTVDSSALAAALRAEDRSTITNPGAKAFRRFADSTGADLLALAAQAERVHRSPIALGSITAPTRLVVGEADPLASRPERLVAAIPGAELVVVPGNHLRAVGAAEFAPAIVDFLAVR